MIRIFGLLLVLFAVGCGESKPAAVPSSSGEPAKTTTPGKNQPNLPRMD